MKLGQICRIVLLWGGGWLAPIVRCDDSAEKLIKLLQSGDIKVKVSPNIDLKGLDIAEMIKGLKGAGGGINLMGKWVADPNNPWMRRWEPGLLEGLKDGLSGAMVPLQDAFQDTMRGFASDLIDWKANLYAPATYGDRMSQLRRYAYYGMLAATIPTVGILMKKGADAAIDIIKYKMTTPELQIIDPEAYPKYGRMDRLSRWWSGYKTPAVIFDQSVKDHLVEIQEKTKNVRDHIRNGDKSATYTNLLLYGPPGTGKTMFARVLADYTDMDFLPTTAAGLLQSTVAFNDLLEMANRSKYGTIIFIDEADALFMDRNRLLQSTAPDALAQYKALNHILAKIGQRNNKFMIVAATNFPLIMDEAMDRRFPEAVELPLPDASARLALLNLYIENELFNEKNNSVEFVKGARALLTPAFVQSLVPRIEGFSHSKIAALIIAMKDATRRTKSGMLTMTDIQNAITRAVERHGKDTAKNKMQQQPQVNEVAQQEVVSAA